MSFENLYNENDGANFGLKLIAESKTDKCLDVAKLDMPIVLTQENRSELPKMSDGTRLRLEVKGYSHDILNAIDSEAEAKIYLNAKIEPANINGKDVLKRMDIDYNHKDIFGQTNLQRMSLGLAPLDTNGRPIELHHIGQKQNSPLAELTRDEHRGKGNDNILHNKLKESEIDRRDFDLERQDHWKERAKQVNN